MTSKNPGAGNTCLLVRFYPEARFGGFSDIDGTMAFYLRVNALLGCDSVVLDFGCGIR